MAKKKTTPKDPSELSQMDNMFLSIWFSNGFNGTAAYKLLHPNASDNTARNEASVFLAKPHIAAEVEMRKYEIAKKGEIRLEENIQIIKKLIDDCMRDGDRKHLLSAIEMLNKLGGFYTTKIESNVNTNIVTWVEEKTYEKPDETI